MQLKHVLPVSVRANCRSLYQYAVHSACWPKPSSWRHIKSMLNAHSDWDSLYRVACEEFDILQSQGEIVAFMQCLAGHQPRIVGEIGLSGGGNMLLFMGGLVELGLLISLDVCLQNVAKLRFFARRGQKLRFIQGSFYSASVLGRVRRLLGTAKFDFLFIDGDHSYQSVLEDFIAYYPLVRTGGLIAFHDIVPDELARRGTRTPGSVLNGGDVYLLWRQLRDRFARNEFVTSWGQYGFGIGVITKPSDDPLDSE